MERVRGPKSAPIEGVHELFGFLTTAANAVVAPIHPKAMPLTPRTPAEVDLWLTAETPYALALQRPPPDDDCGSWPKAKRRTVLPFLISRFVR